jgi:hypothetical protein
VAVHHLVALLLGQGVPDLGFMCMISRNFTSSLLERARSPGGACGDES